MLKERNLTIKLRLEDETYNEFLKHLADELKNVESYLEEGYAEQSWDSYDSNVEYTLEEKKDWYRVDIKQESRKSVLVYAMNPKDAELVAQLDCWEGRIKIDDESAIYRIEGQEQSENDIYLHKVGEEE